MVACVIGIDALVEPAVARIAHVERLVATVVARKLLFDDVGLDWDA